MRSVITPTYLVLAGWLLVGAVWLAVNLGQVPHYADMRADPPSTVRHPAGYLRLAEDGIADPRRGLAYPMVLRGVHAVAGGPWRDGLGPEVRDAMPTETIECWAPRWYTWVQWLQLLVGAAALTWAASIVARAVGLDAALGSARRRVVVGAVVALGLLDPLVAHAHLALMPTALTLAALVVFAAAWTSLSIGHRCGLALALIPGAQLLAGLLRPEKGLVMLAAGLATGLTLLVLKRQDRSHRRRILAASALVVAAFAVTTQLNARASATPNAWTVHEIVTHSRIIYPNLERSWDALSPETQALISRADAAEYDRALPEARLLMHRVCGDDAQLRQSLTDDMVAAVWSTMPVDLVFDCLSDSVTYSLPTLPAYATWADWKRQGSPIELLGQRAYENAYILGLVAYHRPFFSNLYLAGSAVLATLLMLSLIAIGLFGRRRLSASDLALPSAVVVPFTAVWLVNAFAFGLSQKLFEIRYVLISHVVLLMFATGVALTLVLLRPRRG